MKSVSLFEFGYANIPILLKNTSLTSICTGLENLFGDEEDEETKAKERQERKMELIREKKEKGLPVDNAEIEKLLDEEESEAKKKKRRVSC